MRVPIAQIIEQVGVEYQLAPKHLLARTRVHSIAHPRQVIMLLARGAGHSTPKIAAALGLQDHTTVLHGSDAAADRALGDPEEFERLKRIVFRLWPELPPPHWRRWMVA